MKIDVYFRSDFPWLEITIGGVICNTAIDIGSTAPLEDIIADDFSLHSHNKVPISIKEYVAAGGDEFIFTHIASTSIADHEELVLFLEELIAKLPDLYPEVYL